MLCECVDLSSLKAAPIKSSSFETQGGPGTAHDSLNPVWPPNKCLVSILLLQLWYPVSVSGFYNKSVSRIYKALFYFKSLCCLRCWIIHWSCINIFSKREAVCLLCKPRGQKCFLLINQETSGYKDIIIPCRRQTELEGKAGKKNGCPAGRAYIQKYVNPLSSRKCGILIFVCVI